MDRVKEFVDSYLEHADPKYYDPVKAHEYYERTKQLKGRQPSQSEGDLRTDKKKRAWQYSKAVISETQRREQENAAARNRALLQKVRDTANQRRTEIRDKLNALLENISNDMKAETEAAAAKIRRLPPIPRGLSPSAAAAANRKRAEEIAQIRGELDKSRKAKGSKAQSAREFSRSDMEKVRTEASKALDTARSSYEALKKGLKAKYERESQQEFEAIKQNV